MHLGAFISIVLGAYLCLKWLYSLILKTYTDLVYECKSLLILTIKCINLQNNYGVTNEVSSVVNGLMYVLHTHYGPSNDSHVLVGTEFFSKGNKVEMAEM